MASTTQLPAAPEAPALTPAAPRQNSRSAGRRRPNLPGGHGGWLWLAVIVLPLY
jgi:raffinose/stachyose/melibiose transport system permease protein